MAAPPFRQVRLEGFMMCARCSRRLHQCALAYPFLISGWVYFRQDLLVTVHKVVELPISHGLISRMRQLEELLVHFEAREFSYSDTEGVLYTHTHASLYFCREILKLLACNVL